MNRETWLNQLATLMAPRFEELGHKLPKFRVSVGFTSSGKDGRAAAECWHPSSSQDGVYEIFLSPKFDDAVYVANSLAHELAHAAVGFDHGHKGDFAVVALALGMLRPLETSPSGPAFIAWVTPLLAQLGPLPHARLNVAPSVRPGAVGAPGSSDDGEGEDQAPADAPRASSNARPKQKTRLLKCECRECGYTVRTTLKWVQVGPPHCPLHGAMDVDAGEMADA